MTNEEQNTLCEDWSEIGVYLYTYAGRSSRTGRQSQTDPPNYAVFSGDSSGICDIMTNEEQNALYADS